MKGMTDRPIEPPFFEPKPGGFLESFDLGGSVEIWGFEGDRPSGD